MWRERHTAKEIWLDLSCGLELHISPGPGTLVANGLVMTRLLFPSLLFLALHLVVLAMVLVIIVAS